MKLTQRAHLLIQEHLRPGDFALDATAGNGHDTAFLAGLVGENGHVWTLDIQAVALEKTAARLDLLRLSDRVTLALSNHADLRAVIPEAHHGEIRAVMFNLGYLPEGEKSLTTQAHSTLAALDHVFGTDGQAALLAADGLVTVMTYPGHAQGAVEHAAVEGWIGSHSKLNAQRWTSPGPTLCVIRF